MLSVGSGVFFDHLQLRTGAVFGGGGNVYIESSLGIGDSPSRQEINLNLTFNSGSNEEKALGLGDYFLDCICGHRRLKLRAADLRQLTAGVLQLGHDGLKIGAVAQWF